MYNFNKISNTKENRKDTVIINNVVFTLKEEHKKDIFKKKEDLSWDSPLNYDWA